MAIKKNLLSPIYNIVKISDGSESVGDTFISDSEPGPIVKIGVAPNEKFIVPIRNYLTISNPIMVFNSNGLQISIPSSLVDQSKIYQLASSPNSGNFIAARRKYSTSLDHSLIFFNYNVQETVSNHIMQTARVDDDDYFDEGGVVIMDGAGTVIYGYGDRIYSVKMSIG